MRTWLDDARLMRSFRSSLDRLFSDFFEGAPRLETNGFPLERAFPPVNCWEDENNLYTECELPGVEMKDLEVTVIGRDLTLKGVRKPREIEGASYHRQERDYGAFHRVVHLPLDIDSDKVAAELKNGVLTITLPKAPAAKARKIEVKSLTK